MAKQDQFQYNFDISKSQIVKAGSEYEELSGSFMYKEGKSKDLLELFQDKFKVNSKILEENQNDQEANADDLEYRSPESFIEPFNKQKASQVSKRSLHNPSQSITVKSFFKNEETEFIVKEGELLKTCPGVAKQVLQGSRDFNGGGQML